MTMTTRLLRRRPPRAPLTERARALAGDPANLRIALRVARRRARGFPDLADEFESAALWALCLAAATFDPDRGRSWKNHLHARLRGAILDARREAAPLGFRRPGRSGYAAPRVASLSRPIERAPERHGAPETLGETIPSGDLPVGWEAEYHDQVAGLARGLPRGYGRAFVLLYTRASARTFRAAGESLGLTEGRAWSIHETAVGMVRDRLSRIGGGAP